MTNPLLAADPQQNAIVKASAGVGKTYLLVTRLIRLLLDDVPPDAILAITFTRKAAAEMQTRLYERLYELAISDETKTKALLTNIGIEPDNTLLNRAQTLYEKILQSPRQVRCTTFHAFCQDILQRFPLESDVPPGFELLEDVATYQQTAWELLYDEATREPESPAAQALETLFDLTGGLDNTRTALDAFLEQRADWWAYTGFTADPIAYATQSLNDQLAYEPSSNIYSSLFNPTVKENLIRIAELWAMHDNKTNLNRVDLLHKLLSNDVFHNVELDASDHEEAFNQLWNIIHDTKNQVRERAPKPARAKKMTPAGEDEFLQLFADAAKLLVATKEKRNIQYNSQLNTAWYIAGNRLVEIFQQIKAEQRLLDFTDLEWKTYQLLNHSDNALWVQYKLDQRIRHLLVDEFQDTNPTQWNLLLPIIEEFEFQNEESRSVFIVGDEKQSIYSFRRADPLLLHQASHWLQEHLQGEEFPMDRSRRSSPEIMTLVNCIFSPPEKQSLLPDFTLHSTHLETMPGWINLLPLIEVEDIDEEPPYFRNPLEEPRPETIDPFFQEGQLIAQTINELVENHYSIEDTNPRPARYGDIMLLVRSRKHVKQFEKAFREAHIPYISNNKGTLFNCREVQDMIALLTVLHSPYNDVALATVLRSPIFHCSSEDLLYFYESERKTSWYEQLNQATAEAPPPIQLAQHSLSKWRQLALKLPIHDMLDKIYYEMDLVQQYVANFPTHLAERVQNNLSQFLSLALQIDSGRYPSLGRFLARLEHLRQLDASPDEAGSQAQNAVRILTIHASKGLESPIVFLADTCDAKKSAQRHYKAIVEWPQNERKPTAFRICPVKDYYEPSLQKQLDNISTKEQAEDANLLYVALTRARQAVYVSGTSYDGKPHGWYQLIQDHWPVESNTLPSVCEHLTTEGETNANQVISLPDLFHGSTEAPQQGDSLDPEESQDRGIIIHRALDLLTQATTDNNTVLKQLFNEFADIDKNTIQALCEEAEQVVNFPSFQHFFDPTTISQAFNEIPMQKTENNQVTQGIIDRLVIDEHFCYIIDYKTHDNCDKRQLPLIAQTYQAKMQFYRQMTHKIWPEKTKKCIIVFTHFLEAIELA